MRTNGRVIVRRRLSDCEAKDGSLGIHGECWSQGVDACGLEPKLGPVRQIASAGCFELNQKVVQLGVLVGVLSEVLAQPTHERLLANKRNQLLKCASTLGIGDAIEVHLDIV